jgi:hypothetical protein
MQQHLAAVLSDCRLMKLDEPLLRPLLGIVICGYTRGGLRLIPFSLSLLHSSSTAGNHVTEAPINPIITNEIMSPHRFLIASFLPILRAGLTASARFTFPISLRFSFDGLGSFNTHSGTGEPDWSRTFATLFHGIS